MTVVDADYVSFMDLWYQKMQGSRKKFKNVDSIVDFKVNGQ